MSGSPEELLRGALEKIVFFECRVDQIQAELDAARTALARARAESATARRREAELESALANARASESQASAERADLLERVRLLEAERERFLSGMVERARVSGAPASSDAERGGEADLAGFIAELRGEIETLRAWKRAAEGAGVRVDPAGEVRREPISVAAVEAAAQAEPVQAMAARFEQSGRIGGVEREARAMPAGLATRSERALYESALDDLAASDADVRRRAADRLRVLGARTAAPLVAAAIGREPDPEVKIALLGALSAVAEPGAADLAARELADARPPVRAAALDAVHALAGVHALPRLAGALADPAPLVRRRAALLLGFCQGEAAEDALASALQDRDAGVARTAAAALSGRPSARAQGALLKALAKGAAGVREAAVRGVSRWAGEKVDAAAPELDRRAAARRMADRLRELDPAALRGAVTRVAPEPARAVPARAKPVRAEPAVPVRAEPIEARPPIAAQLVAALSRPAAAPAAKSAPAKARTAVAEAPDAAFADAVLGELRGALRGRTSGEIAEALEVAPLQVDVALRALVARGAAVLRGPRFHVA